MSKKNQLPVYFCHIYGVYCATQRVKIGDKNHAKSVNKGNAVREILEYHRMDTMWRMKHKWLVHTTTVMTKNIRVSV